MTDFLVALLPYLGGLGGLVIFAAAAVAFRQTYTKTVNIMHQQVIAAQKEQIGSLKEDIEQLNKALKRCESLVATMRYAFKQQGIQIRVDGDVITLYDTARRRRRVIPLDRVESAADEIEEDRNGEEEGPLF